MTLSLRFLLGPIAPKRAPAAICLAMACLAAGAFGGAWKWYVLKGAVINDHIEELWFLGLFLGFLLALGLSLMASLGKHGLPALMRYLRGEEPWAQHRREGGKRIPDEGAHARNSLVICAMMTAFALGSIALATFKALAS